MSVSGNEGGGNYNFSDLGFGSCKEAQIQEYFSNKSRKHFLAVKSPQKWF